MNWIARTHTSRADLIVRAWAIAAAIFSVISVDERIADTLSIDTRCANRTRSIAITVQSVILMVRWVTQTVSLRDTLVVAKNLVGVFALTDPKLAKCIRRTGPSASAVIRILFSRSLRKVAFTHTVKAAV